MQSMPLYSMAQYSHLPIYTKTYEFVKIVYRIVRQFRKEYKYNLGAELEQIIWQVLDEIVITNSLSDLDKKSGIERISLLFDKFKIRFRLSYEIGLISEKKFCMIQAKTEEIGKMIGGWGRWAEAFD